MSGNDLYPQKCCGLPKNADCLLLFENRLDNAHGNRQRMILRETVRSGNSGQAEDGAISAREWRPDAETVKFSVLITEIIGFLAHM